MTSNAKPAPAYSLSTLLSRKDWLPGRRGSAEAHQFGLGM